LINTPAAVTYLEIPVTSRGN